MPSVTGRPDIPTSNWGYGRNWIQRIGGSVRSACLLLDLTCASITAWITLLKHVVHRVVQYDDRPAVRAVENQFAGLGFPRKMTYDVGQIGVYKPPEEILSAPGRGNDSQCSIWSVLRLRGLGGRLERYEGGLSGVSKDRIESTQHHSLFPAILDNTVLTG